MKKKGKNLKKKMGKRTWREPGVFIPHQLVSYLQPFLQFAKYKLGATRTRIAAIKIE